MTTQIYHFAVVRFMPDPNRAETQNVGLIVRSDRQIAVRWDENFKPSDMFEPKVDRETTKSWRAYFEQEFVADRKSAVVPDSVSEEFWEFVRSKANGPFILGATRQHWSTESNLNMVAEMLVDTLVKRSRRPRARGVDTIVRSFIREHGFGDPQRYKRALQSFKQQGRVPVSFPYAHRNGIFRAISYVNASGVSTEVNENTMKSIGRIALAREVIPNTKDGEFIVLLCGANQEDANYEAVTAAEASPFLLDVVESRAQLVEHLREVCEPI